MIKYIQHSLLRSQFSKFILLLGLICVFLTFYKYNNYSLILVECIGFLYFAYSINCSLYGGCIGGPIFYCIIICMFTLFLISDLLGVFDSYKNTIQKIYKAFESTNDTHMKHLLFPDDEELTTSFKNRTIPKYINKEFKYNNNIYNYNDSKKDEYKHIKHSIIQHANAYGEYLFNSMSNKQKYL